MAIHQAVAPGLDAVLAPILSQGPEVESPVVIVKEHPTTIAAALGDVMRESNRDYSRHPRHA